MGLQTPVVSICCLAYNHEKYIRQCLDSILMQETNFSYELLISDDASTDSTVDILKAYQAQYPDIIKLVLHDENQYQKGVRFMLAEFLLARVKGRYIALCEGDDYWTDPKKLQRQIQFMEENTHVGLLFTDLDILNEHTQAIQKSAYKNHILDRPKTFGELLITGGYIAPPTWVIRKKDFVELDDINPTDETFSIGLDLYARGKVQFLDITTAVYRVHDASITHTKNKKKLASRSIGLRQTQEYYIQKYPRTFLDEVVSKSEDLVAEIGRANQELASKDQALLQKNEEIARIINSKSYRVSRIITSPARFIKKIRRKI